MLGYVRTDRQELRVREDTFYRALYCGLCHRMGKCTGNCSRMTLNYDFVFLAAVRLSLTGEKPEVKKQRCFLHPFRSRPTVQKCDALDFCADASALLVYHKLADDLHDEKGLKKARAVLTKPWMSSAYRRAKRRYPTLDAAIAAHLAALSRYEAEGTAFGGADELAAQFGKLMEAVFAEGLADTDARIAATVGRAVGHWIYLIDAADDFEEDRKRGRFNPYLRLFGEAPTETDWENLRLALTALLCEAERGFLLIDNYPTPELQEILANILYLGLPATAKRIIAKNTCSHCEKETKK
ncbi:MAG: hypothetical protein IJW55_09305 [Clostridia bacterium]|nr:hypothetical protein [Clostridia bacterium]